MDLSHLNNILPDFGAPTLQGLDVGNAQPGQRVKSINRQFVRFYKKKFVEVFATSVRIHPVTGETKVLKSETREVEKEMVEIITPGDKNTTDDLASDYHKREYFRQYQAFRQGRSAPVGTDIEECSFISPSIATELRVLGVHTLEQFSDSSDLLAGQIPSGWELREYARSVVKANTDNKSLGQVNILKAEVESSRALIANMQKQMSELRGMLVNSSGEPLHGEVVAEAQPLVVPVSEIVLTEKPRRGRPPVNRVVE